MVFKSAFFLKSEQRGKYIQTHTSQAKWRGFTGEQGHGIDGKILHQYAKEIKSIHDEGAEICIVIGGATYFAV